MTRTIAVLAAIALAGCATPAPISSNPLTTTTNIIGAALPGSSTTEQAIQTQLLNAEWNLDQAKDLMPPILLPDDPVDTCVHSVNTQIGIEPVAPGATAPAPATSFTPRMTGLLDSGAVAYILAQQALGAKNGLVVPNGCKAIIGDLVIKGGTTAIKLLPGGGLLPALN